MSIIKSRIQIIKNTLLILEENEARYEYLFFLGKRQQHRAHLEAQYELLDGCVTKVFFTCRCDGNMIFVDGYSDSVFVSGLIALICDVYHMALICEVHILEKTWYQDIGLESILTSLRWETLKRLIGYINKVLTQ